VRGLGLSDVAPAVESAQAKLDRVLPEALKRANAALRESIAFHATSAIVGADTRLLRVLSEAAEARRSVLLEYRAADGSESSREFDVYGLVFRAGRWYVVGHSHVRAGLRTLRLDRVVRAGMTPRTFKRPRKFDAVAYLSQVLATLPRALTIEVLLRTDVATARQELFEMLGTLTPCEGGVLLRGTADDLEWFARQLIGLSFPFDVCVPVALNATLARLTERLATRFRQS
jgi:predicted DNA-binding transcriptional regulator YafY